MAKQTAILTGEASSPLLFRHVLPGPGDSTMQFRLLHHWEARKNVKGGPGILLGIEMLMIDEEGTLAQGFIGQNRRNKYEKNLERGSIYTLTNFYASNSKVMYHVADQKLVICISHASVLKKVEENIEGILTERFRIHSFSHFEASCDLRGNLHGCNIHAAICLFQVHSHVTLTCSVGYRETTLKLLADASSVIKYLPGFEGPLPFELETGYIGVGEAEEDQMFYYFIKSERNPEEDPLLVWLSGGPGCSSLTGLFYENGPLAFNVEPYNGSIPSLVSTTYSWTKVANIIYLDQPVGTGFSYTRNPFSDRTSDTRAAKRVNEFLRQWLDNHPEYFSNPFYVTGNSYSGKVVPAIVQEISNGNYICCKPQINLQGYVIGNPITNFDFDNNTRVPFAHGMALISDELFESMKRSCGGDYFHVDPLNTECLKLVNDYKKSVSRVHEANVLQSNCDKTSPDCYMYRYSLSEYWANSDSVRTALTVAKGTKGKWEQCNWSLNCKQDIQSSIPYHMNNSIKGYRSLILSGDHDMTIPFIGTQEWIRSLNFSIIEKWRPWMIQDKVAGYTQTYANKMTYATVKGGGHTPEYKPVESFILFERWISGQTL